MKPTVRCLLSALTLAGGLAGRGETPLAAVDLATTATRPPAKMVRIPSGTYVPFAKTPQDAAQIRVATFLLDETPVTNAGFLAFVRANPKWRRSKVSRLFADESYLDRWAGDLEPGPKAPPDSPVVHVSWFAARAYARWTGQRLPTTAEWEFAAAAGYTDPDGRNDAQMHRDMYAWFARPAPDILPAVSSARANFYGARGLHGLVWEWVEDFNTAFVSSDDSNLLCSASAANVKDTGDYAAFMRQALRSSLKANNTTGSLGFRCARDATTQFTSLK